MAGRRISPEGTKMPPPDANGKICSRQHSDGTLAFDDGVGEVSGMWVSDRPPMREPGIIISIMVDDAAATADKLNAAGAEIVRPLDPNGSEIIAWFCDPHGKRAGDLPRAKHVA